MRYAPFLLILLFYKMPVVRSNLQKVVRRRIEKQRPRRLAKTLGLRDFYNKRNKVLVFRGCGGLGDILMHRMLFEDFKQQMPDAEVHFACPKQYHGVIIDHPFIDQVLDSEVVERHEYLIAYNTSTACGRYEMKIAPLSGKHRSDIWAHHCGIELCNHEMHIQLTEEEKQTGKQLLEDRRNRKGATVLLCPISAMHNKNLLDNQIDGLVKGLWDRGYYVVGIHTGPIHYFVKNDVPYVSGVNLRQWMGVIHQSDYVISVDTAQFHCAGGMKKPLVGIFTFVNAQTYGRYYPTAETIQGLCPAGHLGCYNWGACPVTKDNPKPCLTQITSKMILEKADLMFGKYPFVR